MFFLKIYKLIIIEKMNELTLEQQVINDTRPITDVNLLLEAQKNELYIFNENDKKFYEIPEGHVFDVLTVVYWKKVPNYSKYYSSTNGDIYSLHRNKLMDNTNTNDKYIPANLTDDNKKRPTVACHIIIARTFLENTDPTKSVDHINRDPKCNLLINLRYATSSEQSLNQNHPSTQNHYTPVIMYSKTDTTYSNPTYFTSLKEAGEYIVNNIEKYNNKTIDSIAKGIQTKLDKKYIKNDIVYDKTMYGFIWKKDNREYDKRDWTDINSKDTGGEDGYQICRDGTVSNEKTKNIINGCKGEDGYIMIGFKNRDKKFSVHRLVALTFIHNDDPKKKVNVNHKNGIKHDNRVENLEWTTQKDNVLHAVNNGLISNRIPNPNYIK